MRKTLNPPILYLYKYRLLYFFKTLLYLGAGSVIDVGDEQDMRKMGGLRRFCTAFYLGHDGDWAVSFDGIYIVPSLSFIHYAMYSIAQAGG